MHPGLLIQVEVQDWVKRRPEYPEKPYLYFYYPGGSLSLGSIRICKKDPGRPDPPMLTDAVLLLPDIGPLGPEKNVVQIDEDGTRAITGNQAGIRLTAALAEIEEIRTATSIQELKRRMTEVLKEHWLVGRRTRLSRSRRGRRIAVNALAQDQGVARGDRRSGFAGGRGRRGGVAAADT